MIRVGIARSTDGSVRRLTATGHAVAGPLGGNIVCAAASVLIRTAARALEEESGIRLTGGAGARGEFLAEIESVSPDRLDWVRGVTDSLLRGLEDLAADYPHEVEVRFEAMEGERRHGT